MKDNETHKMGVFLKKLETIELDKLMAGVLREMRRRDSAHMSNDVITGTHSLRKLRATGQLPERGPTAPPKPKAGL